MRTADKTLQIILTLLVYLAVNTLFKNNYFVKMQETHVFEEEVHVIVELYTFTYISLYCYSELINCKFDKPVFSPKLHYLFDYRMFHFEHGGP